MSKKNHPEEAIPETELIAEEPVEETSSLDAESAPAEEPAEATDDATAQLQAKYSALNDKYLRMAAEYDNYRKRSAREREHTHAEAVSYAVKALLPTFDNLERALQQPTEDAEYKKGVELTHRQLADALAGLGVKVIEDAPGTAFDPNLHNAVMHIDDESLGENVIAETFQHGFLLDDKVIRHSMVKVAN